MLSENKKLITSLYILPFFDTFFGFIEMLVLVLVVPVSYYFFLFSFAFLRKQSSELSSYNTNESKYMNSNYLIEEILINLTNQ